VPGRRIGWRAGVADAVAQLAGIVGLRGLHRSFGMRAHRLGRIDLVDVIGGASDRGDRDGDAGADDRGADMARIDPALARRRDAGPDDLWLGRLRQGILETPVIAARFRPRRGLVGGLPAAPARGGGG
jgi:hypothetical protein